MKKDQPTILVVNDDGITAPGIKALLDTMKTIGRVVVVAPQRGVGEDLGAGLGVGELRLR